MLGDLRAHAIAREVDGRALERVTLTRPDAETAADPFADLVRDAEAEIRARAAGRPARERAARRARSLREVVMERPLHAADGAAAVLEATGADFTLRLPVEAGEHPRAYGVELGRLLLEDEG
jgi:hypothetical protein